MRTIGIRQEDKNEWEKRAPLSPKDIRRLIGEHGLTFLVEPSDKRIYDDEQYRDAGAQIQKDLSNCGIILGVKEIPDEQIHPDTIYLCFAHVIKGQESNMPTLATYLERGATLIDYEAICDSNNERLVFFGVQAGQAGMMDALWSLGQRYGSRGLNTPFQQALRAFEYHDTETAKNALAESVGQAIHEGLPAELGPQIFGFTGSSGQVASGAKEVFDILPHETLKPEHLPTIDRSQLRRDVLYKVDFQREHRSHFSDYLEHLTVLVNCAYWEEGQPKVAPRSELQRIFATDSPQTLELLADLACDLGGSVEATTHETTPGEPVFVYDPTAGTTTVGCGGSGPAVLAVGNLPAELPLDASEAFSRALAPLMIDLARASFRVPFHELLLPPKLSRAVIVHNGSLNPERKQLLRKALKKFS